MEVSTVFDLTEKQKENEKWYEQNEENIIMDLKYKNKHLVIYNKKIIQAFEHSQEAVNFALKEYQGFDECVIKEAVDEKEAVSFINVHVKAL